MIRLSLLNWVKKIFKHDVVIEVDSDVKESFNYFLVQYSTNLCGIEENYIIKTLASKENVEDAWCEFSNENALDSVHHAEDLEDLEIYSNVEDITEEEYNRLKEEEYYEDWVI